MGWPARGVCLGVKLGVAGLAITGIFAFTALFSATWGPCVWVVQSEIIPLRARARGSAIATLTNWVLNAVIGKVTPLVVNAIEGYTYVIFASFMGLAVIFVYVAVPETMGKSLEALEAMFERQSDEGVTVAVVQSPLQQVEAAKLLAPSTPASPVAAAVATTPDDRRGRVALASGGGSGGLALGAMGGARRAH